eukprot:jgi/Mesvir1/14701/Mv05357-RA.1
MARHKMAKSTAACYGVRIIALVCLCILAMSSGVCSKSPPAKAPEKVPVKLKESGKDAGKGSASASKKSTPPPPAPRWSPPGKAGKPAPPPPASTPTHPAAHKPLANAELKAKVATIGRRLDCGTNTQQLIMEPKGHPLHYGDYGAYSHVCPNALVTLYARPNFQGPAVSLGCSATDLKQFICFDILSIAVKEGSSAILYEDLNFEGDKIVVGKGGIDNLKKKDYKDCRFTRGRSLFICEGSSNTRTMKGCPNAHHVKTCHAEAHKSADVRALAVIPDDPSMGVLSWEEDIKWAEGGQTAVRFLKPHEHWGSTPGPQTCFYKTFVREAQKGCLPSGEFGALGDILRQFAPEYKGVARIDARWHTAVMGRTVEPAPDGSWGGEYIFKHNIMYGLDHPSYMVVDVATTNCARCGLNILSYKVYKTNLKKYKTYTGTTGMPHQSARTLTGVVFHELGDFLDNGQIQFDVATDLLVKLRLLRDLVIKTPQVAFADLNVYLIYGVDVRTKKMEVRVVIDGFDNVLETAAGHPLHPPLYYEGTHPPAYFTGIHEKPFVAHVDAVPKSVACGLQELILHMEVLLKDGKLPEECLATRCSGCQQGKASKHG